MKRSAEFDQFNNAGCPASRSLSNGLGAPHLEEIWEEATYDDRLFPASRPDETIAHRLNRIY